MKHGLLRLALTLCLWITGACHATGAPPRPLTGEETAALLKADNFVQLNAAFTAVQDAYRDGKISDEDLRAAFRVFYDTDPALLVHFNAWVQKHPDVYVAQLARGIYFKYLGSKRRGTQFIGETSEQQLRGMATQFKEAAEALHASFKLDEKPILSYLHAIDLSNNTGDHEECVRLLDLSLSIDPHNFIVREKYMGTLQSRWGGSLDEMLAFRDESKRAGLSQKQLQVFEALVAEERVWTALFYEHDYAKAARAMIESKKLGRPGCLTCFVDTSVKHERYDDALAALNAALAEDPRDLEVLRQRIEVYFRAGKMKESIADLKTAAGMGDDYSQLHLAVNYLNGVPDVLAPDWEEGKKLLRQVIQKSTNATYIGDAKRNLALAEKESAQHAGATAKH